MSINSRNGNTLLESGFFPPCRAATTASITLSGTQTVDGIALIEGDRVLVKDQADQTTNGIYAAASGNWVRTADANSNAQFFNGMGVAIAQGTVSAGQLYLCTTTDDPVIIGTSLLTFASNIALAAAQVTATSTTSLAVGTGAKSLAIQSGKQFVAEQWVLIYETSNVGVAMLGQISSYVGSTLDVNVTATSGAGTHADWSIVLANSSPSAGLMPPLGSGNVTGPGAAVSHNLARYADTTGKVIEDSGIAAGALASRSTLQHGDAGAGSIQAAALDHGATPLPFVGALDGRNLVLANDVTNPNTDITVSVGRVRNSTDTTNLEISAARLKRLDTTWAAGGVAGTRKGMLDTGAVGASSTYHVYAIGKLGMSPTQRSRASNVANLTIASHGLGVGSDVRVTGVGGGYDGLFTVSAVPDANTIQYANTGANEGSTAVSGATVDAFDILASLSVSAPAMPSGWTVAQALGSLLTNGSASIFAFTQINDEFFYTTQLTDFVSTGTGSKALSVPKGLSVEAITNMAGNAAANTVFEFQVLTPGQSGSSAQTIEGSTASLIAAAASQVRCYTDTSGQISLTVTACSVTITTRGWRDPRRRYF